MCELRILKSRTVISLLALALLGVYACSWDRHYVLKNLPVGHSKSIIILADSAAEISTGIYYQVKIGEETVVSTSRICGAAKDVDSLNFKILSASGGNLIALYEETNPERILALHDFSKGRSWPRGAPEEWSRDISNRGENLLEQLQQEYPNSNFRLNREAPCGIKIPDGK
jgi:hypothetical protein